MVSRKHDAVGGILTENHSALMYNHRSERNRVDVVDLDPYGTAAPFIDGAVQCVNDGGLSLAQGMYKAGLTVLCRLALRNMYRHVSSRDH